MKTVESRQTVVIPWCDTTGGTHLCGDAVFPDGTKYRFVLENGACRHLYIFHDGKYTWNDYVNRASKKVAAVLEHALPLLPAALERKRARDAAEEAETAKKQQAYLAKEALEAAAPDLLEACRAALNVLEQISCYPSFNAAEVIQKLQSAITTATNNSTKE